MPNPFNIFKKQDPATNACASAIAYFKAKEAVSSLPNIKDLKISPDEMPVVREFDRDLVIMYLIDQGSAFRYTSGREMAAAGLDGDGMYQIGLKNLSDAVRPKLNVQDHGGVYTITCGGNFEASMLLLMNFWNMGLAEVVKNGLVAAIPARDILAFCPPGNAKGIESLKGLIERVTAGGDHLLTRSLYEYAPDGWRILTP